MESTSLIKLYLQNANALGGGFWGKSKAVSLNTHNNTHFKAKQKVDRFPK